MREEPFTYAILLTCFCLLLTPALLHQISPPVFLGERRVGAKEEFPFPLTPPPLCYAPTPALPPNFFGDEE